MRTTWDLEQLYKSADDPQMEKDVKALERVFSAFAKKYRGAASYARSEAALARALGEYEAMLSKRAWGKPLSYFQFRLSLDSGDAVARAKLNQLMERLTKSYNQIIFFELSLMKIPPKLQKRFLKSPRLERYRHFLKTIFARAAHTLSEAEEKIMSLKEIPAYQQWIDATDKLLGR
ncbi:MAG: hypothetical protein KGI79_00460, partial [Patescibacteria group bacterium]|nr:hypothetical protein [Patescibacteria group bacterium]